VTLSRSRSSFLLLVLLAFCCRCDKLALGASLYCATHGGNGSSNSNLGGSGEPRCNELGCVRPAIVSNNPNSPPSGKCSLHGNSTNNNSNSGASNDSSITISDSSFLSSNCQSLGCDQVCSLKTRIEYRHLKLIIYDSSLVRAVSALIVFL
jgi:hypothetical protein